MIDPKKITNFKLNPYQLQEVLSFWICVAGKSAATIAPRIDKVIWFGYKILNHRGPKIPFKIFRELGKERLSELLKNFGIGCYSLKAGTLVDIANSDLNLSICSREDLIKIKGIGLKTASCFIMHSRKNSRCAGLDTHLAKFMHSLFPKEFDGEIPKSKKQYFVMENRFLAICDKLQRPPAKLDLLIWKLYAYHQCHAKRFVEVIESRINQ
jgi:thermostable 8-oxoguanine DNA glycosylase